VKVTRRQRRSEFKSVRIDAELRARLREAARMTRVSESELVRDAVARYVEGILGDRLDRRLADIIGVGVGGSGHSRRTGEAFTTLLRKRHP
jgi:predicted NBD/HSP70 family sugar kinase